MSKTKTTKKAAAPKATKSAKATKAAPAKKANATKSAAKKVKATNGESKAKKVSAIDAAAQLLAASKEPMGCKEMIEAMAAGVPVVSSGSGALAEVLDGGALLIDPRSVDEIADALARVLGDAELRAELLAKGRARAARFSWEETASRTREVYRRAHASSIGAT